MKRTTRAIREQLKAYKRGLALANAAQREDNLIMVKVQIMTFRSALELVLSKKYVDDLFDEARLNDLTAYQIEPRGRKK